VQNRGVNRLTALLIAIALWAAIYLPGLGSTEMKGEEGRRVMPAVTMMEGGSWVVPEVGGKPYLRKPPLMQWCMVASMNVFGKNTWAARLPSALGVLALAAAMILCTRRWLIAEQSLMAAIILMAQVAMIEKCRLAEIEGVYVALSGLAILLWMSWWAEERSPWLVWTVPFVFNGLAILAKAPLHLLFFYAVVVAALIARGELRRLWSLPHLAGLLVMSAIVAAWAVPYFHLISAGEAGQVWKRQFVERVTGAEMDWVKWLLNIPNGLGNHLPWVLFVPLLWRDAALQGLHPRGAALMRGGRCAVAICFVVLLLIPGVLPRYVQPLAVPFSLLLAVAIWDPPQWVLDWWRKGAMTLTIILFIGAISAPFVVAEAVTRGGTAANPLVAGLGVLFVFCGALMLISLRKRVRESVHLGIWTGAIAAMAMLLYATAAVPWMHLKEDIRPFAQRIDKAAPDGVTLFAYSLEDYAPLLATLFYLQETPIAYAPDPDHAPQGRQLYLVRGKDDRKFRNRFRIEGEPIASWLPEGEKAASVVVWAERIAK
jgi:4-amino-4-deoxy-L-arabinose transferase-like glycosyltransferase